MKICPRRHDDLHGRATLDGLVVMAWYRRGMLVMVLRSFLSTVLMGRCKHLKGAVLASQEEGDAAQACQRLIESASRGHVHNCYLALYRADIGLSNQVVFRGSKCGGSLEKSLAHPTSLQNQREATHNRLQILH